MGHPRQMPRLLPAKLLAIRKHLNKSQSQMLTLLKIDDITARISEYEHGTRHPSLLTLLRYSEVSGVVINDLADDTVAVTELTFGKRKRRRRPTQRSAS